MRDRLRALILLAIVLAFPGACHPGGEHVSDIDSIDAVLAEHKTRILAVPGVVGVGEGECDGQPCIKVLILEESADLEERIGSMVEGYPVEFVISGAIETKD